MRVLDYLFGKGRRFHCSFCGKHHSEVAKLIEGRAGSICNNCVKICSDVLMKECVEYRERFGAVIPPGNPPTTEGKPTS